VVTAAGRPWWEGAVVYQVYPRSFADADGDGVGDLRGIAARLDHLAWLGVDAIWLSPVFRSPMRDFGYDVADHCAVDPVFGSLADFDLLVAESHALGIRVLLDYVPNHVSSDHPWFRSARGSRAGPRRDWFIWRDPAPGGGPPNGLRSEFGGSAWTLDDASGQYWFHTFLPEQPELDWRNPAVRAAMHDVLRFWFDRGVDGVRIDVAWLLAKDGAPWSDEPVEPPAASAHGDGPETHARMAELRAVADAYPGRLLIGEIYLPPERLVRYYGPDGRGLHLPFNFGLVTAPWTAAAVGAAIASYEAALPPGACPNWVLGNHDQPRIATRSGAEGARAAAMLLLTLRGTATLYYGEEIGLEDVPVPPERVVDVAGRDPARAPMPWAPGPGAGFTNGVPWLPLVPDADERNVASQRADARSILALHRRLIGLRHAEPALRMGTWSAIPAPDGVVAFDRTLDGRTLRVLLALDGEARDVPVGGRWLVACSTGLDRDGEHVADAVDLRSGEGLVLAPVR
jgi:alpha-glucosidase